MDEQTLKPMPPAALPAALASHALWVTSAGRQGAQLVCEDPDLREVPMQAARLDGAIVPGANLSGADCTGADFSAANLASGNLAQARLVGAAFVKANLDYANLDGAHAHKARFFGADCYETSAQAADFSQADLRHGSWHDATLTSSNLRGSRLDGATFTNCDARLVDWSGISGVDTARLTNVRFTDTLSLAGEEARAWMRKAASGTHLVPTATYALTSAELGALLAAGGIVPATPTLAEDLHASPRELQQAREAMRAKGWLVADNTLRADVRTLVDTLARPNHVLLFTLRDKAGPRDIERLITCSLGDALCTANWVDAATSAENVQQHAHAFALADWPLLAWHMLQQHGALPVDPSTPATPGKMPPPATVELSHTGLLMRLNADKTSAAISWYVAGGQLWRILPEPTAPQPIRLDQLAQDVFALGG